MTVRPPFCSATVAVVLALATSTPALADPGYVAFEGGRVMLLPEPSVTMASEHLVFRYVDEPTDHWEAELTYRLRNDGEARQIEVALPFLLPPCDGADVAMPGPCSDEDLDPFELEVDGSAVAVTRMDVAGPGYNRLYVAELAWEPGQTRTLVYRYRHYEDDRYEFTYFHYFQVTGRGWAGPIGDAHIEFQLPPGLRGAAVSLPARRDGDWIHVELSDWEPYDDFVVTFVGRGVPLEEWVDYFGICESAQSAPPAEWADWATAIESLGDPPDLERCVRLPDSNARNFLPRRYTYYCPLLTESQAEARCGQMCDRDREEVSECLEALRQPPDPEQLAASAPVPDVVAIDDDPALAVGWVRERLTRAREGRPELVRIAVAPRHLFYEDDEEEDPEGDERPERARPSYVLAGEAERFGGRDAFLPPVLADPNPTALEANADLDADRALVLEGQFSGRLVGVPAEYGTTTNLHFEVERARRLRSERDARLRVLLDPEATAHFIAPFDDDRAWLAIVDSVGRRSGGPERAQAVVARLGEAGFEQAEWFDSRRAPLLFCCFYTVVAGRYATREEAVEAVEAARAAGFAEAYPKQGWTERPARLHTEEALCEQVQTERDARIAEAWARFRAAQPDWDEQDHPPRLPSEIGRCYAASLGVWAITLEGIRFEVDPDAEWELLVDAEWAVSFLTYDGRRAGRVPDLDTGLSDGNYYRDVRGDVDFERSELLDWDGDGVQEIWFEAHYEEAEDADVFARDVYTFVNGEVREYDAAGDIPSPTIEDVDDDGHPDLLTHGPFEAVLSYPCVGMAGTHRGPELLAHALAGGGFSFTDEVATAWARRACPAPPSTIADMGDVACARLWGLDAEAILAMAACPDWAQDSAWETTRAHCDDSPRPPALCFNLDVVRRWAEADVPITLRGEGPAPD